MEERNTESPNRSSIPPIDAINGVKFTPREIESKTKKNVVPKLINPLKNNDS